MTSRSTVKDLKLASGMVKNLGLASKLMADSGMADAANEIKRMRDDLVRMHRMSLNAGWDADAEKDLPESKESLK